MLKIKIFKTAIYNRYIIRCTYKGIYNRYIIYNFQHFFNINFFSFKALTPIDFSSNPEYEHDFRWYDHTLLDAVRSDEEHVQNFFRLLALCHTVMPEYVEGRLEYQAQSPDESALVSAARNFGFVFRSRTPNSIAIEVMGRTEVFVLKKRKEKP